MPYYLRPKYAISDADVFKRPTLNPTHVALIFVPEDFLLLDQVSQIRS